ncbi:AAA family ATPase [Paracoccaceae bacterium Fryx2]|nr:AAA family ATPase [Paracoccaceae bacterium Fryx2]
MAEHLKLINPYSPPETGRFVMTETATDILRTLGHVRNLGGEAIGMIAAAPGMGKTETLLHYLHGAKRTFLFTCVAGEASPFSLAFGLMRSLELGEPNNCRMPAERLRIAEAIGTDGMLLVDEAQNLVQRYPKGGADYVAFEWLRETARDGCFPLVLCGDLKLLDAREYLPQLRSRIRRPVVVRRVPEADVQALAARRSLTDARIIEALYAVARHHGALRDVANVIDHASLFSGGERTELAHVLAAIEDLKLQPKGGK